MSQNMLVFEKEERNRFPWGPQRWRYQLLQVLQSRSLRNATGNIFISRYAKDYISDRLPELQGIPSRIIPLGASTKFSRGPERQYTVREKIDNGICFRLTYVSIVNYYKHQWNVIEAVARLREEGYPVQLQLVGPVVKGLRDRISAIVEDYDSFVEYSGVVPYQMIEEVYHNTDIFIFASSCENMPNVLVEAMSAGLPIASSHYGPMPEILRDGGRYFDPLQISEIADAVKFLLDNPSERSTLAQRAHEYAQQYTWQDCAVQTLTFLSEMLKDGTKSTISK
ncbi:glycosyltransferase [Lewinella sp. JB7]|uniref:glycosyltransferase n=1 Tax=Lewinella sp. JB7 TaxID=2962887 RepID=UPI003531F72A